MIESFVAGFSWTARVILCITGGVSALAACIIVLAIMCLIAGAAFNLATEHIARRWEASGKKPTHKLGQIIMRSRRDKTGQ